MRDNRSRGSPTATFANNLRKHCLPFVTVIAVGRVIRAVTTAAARKTPARGEHRQSHCRREGMRWSASFKAPLPILPFCLCFTQADKCRTQRVFDVRC